MQQVKNKTAVAIKKDNEENMKFVLLANQILSEKLNFNLKLETCMRIIKKDDGSQAIHVSPTPVYRQLMREGKIKEKSYEIIEHSFGENKIISVKITCECVFPSGEVKEITTIGSSPFGKNAPMIAETKARGRLIRIVSDIFTKDFEDFVMSKMKNIISSKENVENGENVEVDEGKDFSEKIMLCKTKEELLPILREIYKLGLVKKYKNEIKKKIGEGISVPEVIEKEIE